MITAATRSVDQVKTLHHRSMRELEQLARRYRIVGAAAMKKEQLVKAIAKAMGAGPSSQKPLSKGKASGKPASKSVGASASKSAALKAAKGMSSKAPAPKRIAKAGTLNGAKSRPAMTNGQPSRQQAKSVPGKTRPAQNGSSVLHSEKHQAPKHDLQKRSKLAKLSQSHRVSDAERAEHMRRNLEMLTPPSAQHPFQPLPIGATRKSDPIKDLSVRVRAPVKPSDAAEGDHPTQMGRSKAGRSKLNHSAKAEQNAKPAAPLAEPRDRIVLMVRDSFWLQAEWEVSRRNVERARAAMAEHWHSAKPIARVYEVDDGGANTCEQVLRDIEIHGGVNTWHIDVYDAPRSYRVAIGYLASNGKFHALARSNAVTTPRPGSGDAIDENWSEIAENYEKIYSLSGGYADEGDSGELQELFEERLRRPMGAPMVGRFGEGAQSILNKERNFVFEVDAEMIIYGATRPNARVTIGGEPVKLRRDGTFTVRQAMPDKRQVLPVVASSGDGIEQRTIVLAIERNTKVMEPLIRDGNE